MLHEKFDHFQIWANNTQHIATHGNMVAKRSQHVASNDVALKCCDRLVGALNLFSPNFNARTLVFWSWRRWRVFYAFAECVLSRKTQWTYFPAQNTVNMFSGAWRQLLGFVLSSDWVIVLFTNVQNRIIDQGKGTRDSIQLSFFCLLFLLGFASAVEYCPDW